MKRLLSIVAALLLGGSACLMAQRTYVDSGGTDSELNQVIDLKRTSLILDVSMGESFDIGAHYLRNFNRIISWDMLALRYGRYDDFECSEFLALTGVRVHTPAFGKNKRLKVYGALDAGYACLWGPYMSYESYSYNGKNYKKYVPRTRKWDQLAICPELGIYLSEHLYLAGTANFYALEYGWWQFGGRIGYEF